MCVCFVAFIFVKFEAVVSLTKIVILISWYKKQNKTNQLRLTPDPEDSPVL